MSPYITYMDPMGYTSRVLQKDNYVIDTLAMATGYNSQFNDIGIGVLYKQIQEVYSLFA